MHISRLKRIGLCAAILFSATALLGCTKTNDRLLNAMLNNQAKENYYIWIGDGSLPQGHSAILPGGFVPEQIGFTTKKEDCEDAKEYLEDHIKLHASKDGKDVKSQTIDLSSEYQPGKTMYIRWDGANFKVDY